MSIFKKNKNKIYNVISMRLKINCEKSINKIITKKKQEIE